VLVCDLGNYGGARSFSLVEPAILLKWRATSSSLYSTSAGDEQQLHARKQFTTAPNKSKFDSSFGDVVEGPMIRWFMLTMMLGFVVYAYVIA
jgi:hypothetical protein